jgi:hypothetical protein
VPDTDELDKLAPKSAKGPVVADVPEPKKRTRVLEPGKLGNLKVGPVDQSDPFFNMIVYGEPGVGKTWLAGSASEVEDMSPVLFIDVEGGTLTLRRPFPNVDVVRVTDMEDFSQVFRALHEGTDYKTVVLDSLTEIQKFSMYHIMGEMVAAAEEKGEERDPDIASVREWGKNIEQVRKIVRLFRDLPMNVIFTALMRTDKHPKTGALKSKPSLQGKVADEVSGFVDIVMHMYMKEVNDADAVELGIDPGQHRILLSTSTDEIVAKDRTGTLPPVIIDPSMQDLYKLAFEA